MDDLKASVTSVETAQTVHQIVKRYAESVGMVINNKKCAIQLNSKTPFHSPSEKSPDWTKERTSILVLS